MDRGIMLHPKFGLNPTMPVCFYCGEERGEIALLGARYRGEAPKNMVIDIEPCDECKKKYANYTLLVEVRQEWDVRAYHKRQKGPVPTGRWAAVRKECLDEDKRVPIAYVEPQTMNHIIAQVG